MKVKNQIVYPVMEIFDSIQGEGSMIGMPVTFIRFAGCNLACPWCDTKESWMGIASNQLQNELNVDSYDELPTSKCYEWKTIEDIVNSCNQQFIVMTGGEPNIHNLTPLVEEMHHWSKFVCCETNATLPTPENMDWVVASPKPPQYIIHESCRYNELKYVVDKGFDLSFIPEETHGTFGQVWLQPCDYGKNNILTEESTKKCAMWPLKYPYLRTGIQLHKFLNVK